MGAVFLVERVAISVGPKNISPSRKINPFSAKLLWIPLRMMFPKSGAPAAVVVALRPHKLKELGVPSNDTK